MRLIKAIMMSIILFVGLFFGFVEIQAEESDELDIVPFEELDNAANNEEDKVHITDDLIEETNQLVDEDTTEVELSEEDTTKNELPNDNVEEETVTEDKAEVETESETESESTTIETVDDQTKTDEVNQVEENQKEEKEVTPAVFSIQQATMPYEQGDYHKDLIAIKQKLNAIGFGGITETDFFGGWTTTRVKQFQEYHGMSVTGKIDKTTVDKINSVYNSPFRLGVRHESTIELKEKLNSLGYGYISVTNLYGSWTVNRVKKFQRENGLRVSGIADVPTWSKIDQLLTKTEFKVGDYHPNIVSIKQKLNAIGFNGISETDYYGDWTKTRVTQFQKYYGLNQSGTTNQATLDKLDEVYNSPFQLGKRHESTLELKEKLNTLGYGHISVTNLYGDWTVNRVKKFQRENGLRVNGIADNPTWSKLNQLLSKTEFKVGDRHPNLISIKKQLNALGFDRISETNYFGNWMKTRVTQFQEYYGLSKTGTTNTATMKKLEEIYNSPFQLGKRHKDSIELKQKLNRLGFGYITVTELYGSFTKQQIEKFQRHYGLKINGIADPVTQKKINDIYNSPLQLGKSSAQVVDLKKDLNNLGYGGISLTKKFGSWTETRLKQFQRDKDLPISGIADEITIKKLKDSYLKIFIDPGHGGHDPGGSGFGLQEKSVVLDIGLKTANILSKEYHGINIKLSRESDTYLSLADRTKLANSWGADYLISLHTNAWLGKGQGFESFIFNGTVSQETRERQKDIHNYLAKRISVTDRGKKQANFHMVRESTMPSILLEYMFIDNKRENDLLRSSSYRSSLARWTAEAIANSFNLKRK